VAVAAEREPHLILTVDNGISSHAGVEAAKDLGMRVLVTDHHLPAATVPPADAIVNPNQNGCGFESKALAGVGVIFYVMLALRARLRENGWFEERDIEVPKLAELLDLVALGTVADVVPLDANNRILVAQGLARIRRGLARPGIRALIDIAGRRAERLVSADMGFALGPRLNAAGRLDDMSVGIRCLLSEDEAQARELAARLDGFNRERRAIETQMNESALAELEEYGSGEDELPTALCLYRPDWHEGVIGILASRIKERFHRPVIVFTDAADGQIKGSARSIPGLHIRDALDSVAVRHEGLLVKFGGHAMAAGLTLVREDYETFRSAFVEEARRWLSEEDLQGVILSDGPLEGAQATLELAQALRFGGPWGQAFPEPMYDGVFDVVQHRIVGERHLKMVLRWPDSGGLIDAIAFNRLPEEWLERDRRARAAFRLDVNEFRGEVTVQLVVEHLEPAVGEAVFS
jgi:single-stranded-DNA-specific exonuclease